MAPIATSPALLVVHGIGTQKRGDTLRQCVDGLLSICGDALLVDAAGTPIEIVLITAQKLDHVRIRHGSTEIRLYEVYWADLLPDASVEGSFSKFDFEETTWFPLLNWRAGLLPRTEYPGRLIAVRTVEMWLLQVAMSLALEFATASQWVRSKILDQTAADVWNYVHSLGGELAPDSPLTGAGERALDRFQSMWERARSEGGPDGETHVIAHSLGSVVAYHALCRRLPAMSIQRLVTIGSPLEKVRFLWAKLFPENPFWPGEWLNYHAPSDPVSGRLKRFDADADHCVQNIRLWGLGGFGAAHVRYFHDPRVAATVASGLGVPITRTPARAGVAPWLLRRAIDVAVPALAALLTIAGTLLTFLFFYAVAWITGAFVEFGLRFFSPDVARMAGCGWRLFWVWIMMPLWLLFLTKDGYLRAAARHERSWRR